MLCFLFCTYKAACVTVMCEWVCWTGHNCGNCSFRATTAAGSYLPHHQWHCTELGRYGSHLGSYLLQCLESKTCWTKTEKVSADDQYAFSVFRSLISRFFHISSWLGVHQYSFNPPRFNCADYVRFTECSGGSLRMQNLAHGPTFESHQKPRENGMPICKCYLQNWLCAYASVPAQDLWYQFAQ